MQQDCCCRLSSQPSTSEEAIPCGTALGATPSCETPWEKFFKVYGAKNPLKEASMTMPFWKETMDTLQKLQQHHLESMIKLQEAVQAFHQIQEKFLKMQGTMNAQFSPMDAAMKFMESYWNLPGKSKE